jgi:hypothetical protein
VPLWHLFFPIFFEKSRGGCQLSVENRDYEWSKIDNLNLSDLANEVVRNKKIYKLKTISSIESILGDLSN